MPSKIMTRRLALAGMTTCAFALAACAPTNAPSVQATRAAAPGLRVRDIRVNTAPLLAQSGNPTAAWVQTALPAALAQTFALAPDDASAPTLSVRVNAIILGPIGPEGGAIDTIKGMGTLGGRTTRLRATAFYTPSPVDQALVEQALQGRVTTLAQAFAQALPAKLGR